MRKFSLATIVFLALLLLTVSGVSAHAKLVKANPAPNSVLGTAPSQVQLWFDEAVEPTFSEIQVLDSSRNRVDTGPLSLAPGDDKSMIIALKPVGDGTYSVVWKVLSATDGHITRGVFAFSVGKASTPAVTSVESGSAPSELTPFSAFVRWVSLFALLALEGGILFRVILLERSLRFVGASMTPLSYPLAQGKMRGVDVRWTQLTLLALVLALLAGFLELVLQGNLVVGEYSISAVASVLTATRFGTLWVVRLVLLLLCGAIIVIRTRGVRITAANIILPVLGALALLTRSLESHGAAAGDFSIPVAADWLHLMAVSLWVGGLFYVTFLVPFVWRSLDEAVRSKWIAWLVPQFTKLALPATIVILITGLYSSVQQIPALDLLTTRQLPTADQLVTSFYNDALGLKVLLFAVMIGFGALNFLLISPRFRRAIQSPAQSARIFTRFRLIVAGEVTLGLSAIFLAGLLTLSTPPRSESAPAGAPTTPAPPAPLVLLANPASDVNVVLTLGPDGTAPTQFDAHVTDPQGKPLANMQRVIFNFTLLSQDTGVQNVIADAKPDSHYVTDGDYLALDGMWRIRVTVRRQGVDDVVAEFPFYVAPPKAAAQDPAARTLLDQSTAAMNSLTSLRSTQELNDGAGGLAVSHYQYLAPDKTSFSIEGQGESIATGPVQYFQNKDGSWLERPRVEPFVFPAFDTTKTAESAQLGRPDFVNGIPAQIVTFNTQTNSDASPIHYAYWINNDDHRLMQFQMVTDSHYMTQSYFDFDSKDIAINAPANAVAPATPAPNSAPAASVPANVSPRPRGFITGDLEGDGALLLVVVGIVILLVGTGAKRSRDARVVTLGTGVASILVGIGLFADALNGTNAAISAVPIDANRASSGAVLYNTNCMACHGVTGHGDGPAAANLPVKPFDLTTHVLLHDEQYLHAVILNGRGYMPAFGDRLTQDQILDVIAYTRLLARQAQQQNPAAGFTPKP